MAVVTKKNVKLGLKVFSAYDDRPFDGYGINEGIVTEIYDDHYIYNETDLGIDIWGMYDTNLKTDSVAAFTTKPEAEKWLKSR